jgi:uncharacterized protein (TIGR00299 family) protein
MPVIIPHRGDMAGGIKGLSKIVVIDCQVAGISGDMFLASLLDLGADVNRVIAAIKMIEEIGECKNVRIHVRDVTRRGIRAKRVDVEADGWPELTGAEFMRLIKSCVDNLGIGQDARKFALNVAETLLNAEAKLHSEDPSNIHLHELGHIDAIAEIIGSAVALEDLGLFNAKIYSTPIAVGGGIIEFSHGRVPSPAPATLEILMSRGFPIIGGPIEAELTTPTGASILVNLVDEVTGLYPALKPLKVGYGAGVMDFEEMPNILRVILGEPLHYSLSRDEVIVLETNLDDVTGEILGHASSRLLAEGARDVSIIPMFTKKNRPGYILKIIADRGNAERLAHIIMEETGSLGVRLYACERRILVRDIVPIEVMIDGVRVSVRMKVSRDAGGSIIRIKPEYDDLERIAGMVGKPLRHVLEAVEAQARRLLLGEGS